MEKIKEKKNIQVHIQLVVFDGLALQLTRKNHDEFINATVRVSFRD